MANKRKNEKEINVDLGDTEPVFSDAIQIGHKDDQFTLSFLHRIPNANQAKMKSIVTITPQHAKRLVKALQENINKYEQKFGEIELEEENVTQRDIEVR